MTKMIKTELYFGLTYNMGMVKHFIEPCNFDRFVADIITPCFPDGLTILSGCGQWLSGDEIIKERCKIVIIIHPDDGTNSEAKIGLIRSQYRSQFAQDSVLRVDSEVSVSF